uniref:Uncharacterized protein n=1 Tax=Arundo donax TaxID=35708 RepID=A0A0A9A976_ARUDO
MLCLCCVCSLARPRSSPPRFDRWWAGKLFSLFSLWTIQALVLVLANWTWWIHVEK